MSNQKKQTNFSFRYQPSSNSTDTILLDYLKDYAVLDTKTLVLDALRAFWLPFAYQESLEYNDKQVERIGWHCVFTLINQIERICCILDLDRSQLDNWSRKSQLKNSSSSDDYKLKVDKEKTEEKNLIRTKINQLENKQDASINHHQKNKSSASMQLEKKSNNSHQVTNKNEFTGLNMLSYQDLNEQE